MPDIIKKNAGQNNYRAIRAHLLEEDGAELSIKQKEILDRYVDLYGLIKRYGQNKRTVIKFYRALKKDSDDLPSDIHLMRDMKSAMQLFGNIDRVNKEVLQMMLIDNMYENTQNFEALAALCLKKDENGNLLALTAADAKIFDMLMNLKYKFDKNIIEAGGINKVVPEMPDFTKLEAHTYTIKLDPAAEHIITKMMEDQKGSVMDLRDYYDETIIDEYEIIESNNNDE